VKQLSRFERIWQSSRSRRNSSATSNEQQDAHGLEQLVNGRRPRFRRRRPDQAQAGHRRHRSAGAQSCLRSKQIGRPRSLHVRFTAVSNRTYSVLTATHFGQFVVQAGGPCPEDEQSRRRRAGHGPNGSQRFYRSPPHRTVRPSETDIGETGIRPATPLPVQNSIASIVPGRSKFFLFHPSINVKPKKTLAMTKKEPIPHGHPPGSRARARTPDQSISFPEARYRCASS